MKDVLITGGAGKIGYDLVLKLMDSKYSVTVLDLKSKLSEKKLNKLSNKIKIVYGDIEDKELVESLIKKNDIVIDYAGIMPPLANIDPNIANKTNYIGTKNIVDSIMKVNPDCVYIYMSFISVYGNPKEEKRRLTVDTKTDYNEDLYTKSLVSSEEYIKTNLRKYTILRMPIVLTKNNYYINHIKIDRRIDFISPSDLNEIVIGIMRSKKVYGKTYNISGFKANTNIFLKNMYKSSGKLKYVLKRHYYGEYDDADEIESIISIKYQNIGSYFKKIKKETNPLLRIIRKIIYLPNYLLLKRRDSK